MKFIHSENRLSAKNPFGEQPCKEKSIRVKTFSELALAETPYHHTYDLP
jgi:hypothetical protein